MRPSSHGMAEDSMNCENPWRWWVTGGGQFNFDATMPWDWIFRVAWILSSLTFLWKRNLVAYWNLIALGSAPFKITRRLLADLLFPSPHWLMNVHVGKRVTAENLNKTTFPRLPKAHQSFPTALTRGLVPRGAYWENHISTHAKSFNFHFARNPFQLEGSCAHWPPEEERDARLQGTSETPMGELKSLLVWNYCWEL